MAQLFHSRFWTIYVKHFNYAARKNKNQHFYGRYISVAAACSGSMDNDLSCFRSIYNWHVKVQVHKLLLYIGFLWGTTPGHHDYLWHSRGVYMDGHPTTYVDGHPICFYISSSALHSFDKCIHERLVWYSESLAKCANRVTQTVSVIQYLLQ